MKRLTTLLIALIIGLTLIAQSNFRVLKVPTATSNIQSSLSDGDEIVNYGTNETWRITQYYPSGGKTLTTITGKVLVNAVTEAPEDGNQYARQDANWSEIVIPEPAPSASGGNYVNFTGTEGSSATANADSLTLAFTRGDHVFVKSGTYFMGSYILTKDQTLLFEHGAQFNVTGSLTIEGGIQAGLYQIFTITSNVTGTSAKIPTAYSEWFGAVADNVTESSEAINKCLQVFNVSHQSKGAYAVDATIVMDKNRMTLTSDFQSTYVIRNNVDFVYVTGNNYKVQGGKISFLNTALENSYTSWIINVAPFDNSFPSRYGGLISGWFVLNTSGLLDKHGSAYNGIKIRIPDDTPTVDAAQSYFGSVENIHLRGADTAIYIQGYIDGGTKYGMVNSWHWSKIFADACVRGIVAGEHTAGHLFTDYMFQTTSGGKYSRSAIDMDGRYYKIDGMFWDFYGFTADTAIVLREAALENKITITGSWSVADTENKPYYYNLSTNFGNYTSNTFNGHRYLNATTFLEAPIYNTNSAEYPNRLKVNERLTIEPVSSDPSTPAEGAMWFNSSTNTLNFMIGGVKYTVDATIRP